MTAPVLSAAQRVARPLAFLLAGVAALGLTVTLSRQAGARQATAGARVAADDSVRTAAAARILTAELARAAAERHTADVMRLRDSLRAELAHAAARLDIARHAQAKTRADFTLRGDTVVVHRATGDVAVALPEEVSAFVRVTDRGVDLQRSVDSVRVQVDTSTARSLAALAAEHVTDSTALAAYRAKSDADDREIADLTRQHAPRFGVRTGVALGALGLAAVRVAAHLLFGL